MPEVWFYHLVGRSVESVLPTLLEKALQREWNVVVQFVSADRLAAMDEHLYTWSDESFLPHGSARDGDAEEHPIWLTLGDDNPNGAKLRICVDGARAEEVAKAGGDAYDRIILIFDGAEDAALQDARAQWKALKGAGFTLSYFQQNESGGWEKKA